MWKQIASALLTAGALLGGLSAAQAQTFTLKFSHAANLPFSNRGTGITFTPATRFAHASNEPVQPLGTGITLDRPLTGDHAIDAVVRRSPALQATVLAQGGPRGGV